MTDVNAIYNHPLSSSFESSTICSQLPVHTHYRSSKAAGGAIKVGRWDPGGGGRDGTQCIFGDAGNVAGILP